VRRKGKQEFLEKKMRPGSRKDKTVQRPRKKKSPYVNISPQVKMLSIINSE
jgi:hypothetical protein